MLMLVLAAVAGAVAAILAVAFMVITIAIRAEDRHAGAIRGPAPGRRAVIARRVVGLHVIHPMPYDRRPEAASSGTRGERR